MVGSVPELVGQILQGVPVNAVLRERLTLAMERRVAAEAEAAALRGENEKLIRENQQQAKELEELKKKLAERHAGGLKPEQEQILALLSKRPDMTTAHLASAMKVSAEFAEFHIEELRKKRMLDGRYSTIDDTTWYLMQEGRRYLIERGLLT